MSKKIETIKSKYEKELVLMNEQMSTMQEEINHLRKSQTTVQQIQIENKQKIIDLDQ